MDAHREDTSARAQLLVVATHRAWIAGELAQAGTIRVQADAGLDAPDLGTLRAAWWTPTEHAARLLRAGVRMNLAAPGPDWLTRLGPEHTRREIWTGTLASIADAPRKGWAKPAEAKVENLPAAWWDDMADFADAARGVGAPETMAIQVSPTTLDIAVEYRAFLTRGHVTAISAYLRDGDTYTPDWDTRPDPGTGDAASYAQHVADQCGTAQPDGYTLDVVRTRTGGWAVLEANPAWSSNPYQGDPAGVVEAILASSTGPEATHGPYQWRIDPWIAAHAARKAPLRLARPAWTLPS